MCAFLFLSFGYTQRIYHKYTLTILANALHNVGDMSKQFRLESKP